MATKHTRRARRERQRLARLAEFDAALSITCPACGAIPGVCCFVRGVLGPDLHERRYAASSKES